MPIRVAVLGAGGLGKSAARILSMKNEAVLTAICDSNGFAFNRDGLDCDEIAGIPAGGTVADTKYGVKTENSLDKIISSSEDIDGIFIALPNLPNEFIPGVIKKFCDAGLSCVYTDALKRTSAMELMLKLDGDIKKSGSVYISGAGCTPGILSAAAVIAAQSFIEIEKVDIWWGVGISNWDAYRATIREDIAHLPGYDVAKAQTMTDQEVEELLDKTNGILELNNMEHADDILLEMLGIVSRDKVEVGGVMDTRNPEKPVSTIMTLTGITYEGKRAAHKFILGDETSMSANVIGPALGYMKRGLWLKEHGITGIFGSTELMPMFMK